MEASLLFSNGYELKKHRREISRNIPVEVLFEEILVRLPVKSLTIYKSVCKTWRHMIESRPFIDAHRRRHSHDYPDQILFSPFKSVSDPVTMSSYLLPSTQSFCPDLINMTSRPIDVMLPPEMTRLKWPDDVELDELNLQRAQKLGPWRASVTVLGPIRTTGIYCIVANLLCGGWNQETRVSLTTAKIAVCNPATRDYNLASPFPPEETASRLSELTGRQPCRVHYGFGLANDGDYKVVVVMTWGLRYSSFLSLVYSLKHDSWKKISDADTKEVSRSDVGGRAHFPEIVDFRWELCPQVFSNGCWHWMAMLCDYTCAVLSFDVDSEAFRLVRGPPSYRGHYLNTGEFPNAITNSMLSVLNDHLAALYHSYEPTSISKGVISVWMMMDYGVEESWTNVYRVNLNCHPIIRLVGISYSLRDDGNGVHIDRISVQDCGRRLVSFDEFGTVQQQPGCDFSSCIYWNTLGVSDYNFSSCIYWNTLGVSDYRETLEPLNIQDSTDAADIYNR